MRVGCKLVLGNECSYPRALQSVNIDARVGGESKEEGRAKCLMLFPKACHENRTPPLWGGGIIVHTIMCPPITL